MTWFEVFALYVSPVLVLVVGYIVYRATEPRNQTPAE